LENYFRKMMARILFLLMVILALGTSFDLFEKFQKNFNKKYKNLTETIYRMNVFLKNTQKIKELNQKSKGTSFGINKFADLTQQEFRNIYLSKTPVERDPYWPVASDYSSEEINALPTSFDWRTKGAVTGVKDQGQCGSCWSFSATGNMEGQWFLAGHTLVGLSEQNLVDCDHECTNYDNQQSCDAGCDGGLQPNAYKYVIKTGGIDTESSYPYEAVDGTCNYQPSDIGAKISNFTMISSDENQMAAYLVQKGPLAIAVSAEEWQFYIGGVFYLPCTTSLDHGVLIVGYGVETDIFDQTMPYWIIKNSWGQDWGESGYIRVERGTGKCGLNQYVSSSIV